MSADKKKPPEQGEKAAKTEKVEKPAEKVEEKIPVMAQKAYGDFLGAYKSVSESASKMVEQAASILETEIASGIKVANQAESKFPQVERYRAEKPDEVMQRFRRDAHEVVDIFIDVVGATLRSMPNPTEVAATMKEGTVVVKPVQPAAAPRPTATGKAKPGEEAEIQISFENSLTVPTEEFRLYSTDLISDSGVRIPADAILFTPETLKIGPRLTEQITIKVAVPEDAAAGTYSGLVLASNMPQLKSEIVVKVE